MRQTEREGREVGDQERLVQELCVAALCQGGNAGVPGEAG